MKLEQKKILAIQSRLRYLQANDYEAILFVEKGIVIDPALIARKQEARDEITQIEAATTLAEISNLTIEFE